MSHVLPSADDPIGQDPRLAALTSEVRAYLGALTAELRSAFGDDLLGVWLIGSAAQAAYEPGTSDIDVLAVTGTRHPEEARRAVGERVRHPALDCPAVGLEFVVYARPDLVDLADPVRFALNVNGGRGRDDLLALGPDDGPGWWSVLDLAEARVVGVPLHGPAPDVVIPAVPAASGRGRVAGLARPRRRHVDQSRTQSRSADHPAHRRSLAV